MEVSPLTDAVARRLNFDDAYPILIMSAVVPTGSAAATANDLDQLSREMEKVTVGDAVTFAIRHLT